MRTLLSLTALALGTAAVAAVVTSTPTVAATPTAVAPTVGGSYDIDLSHSNILFKCKHLGVSYQWGRFDSFKGSFTLDADASKSAVNVVVDAASVNSNSEGRDDHLRGPDFFDVKQFAEMTFASTKVEAKDGDVFTITGDLTLHGVTKSISFDVTKVGEEETRMGPRAGFEGGFVISRKAYGVKALPGGLGDEVTMHFAIEGVRGK